jgi:hypothetical protein
MVQQARAALGIINAKTQDTPDTPMCVIDATSR